MLTTVFAGVIGGHLEVDQRGKSGSVVIRVTGHHDRPGEPVAVIDLSMVDAVKLAQEILKRAVSGIEADIERRGGATCSQS